MYAMVKRIETETLGQQRWPWPDRPRVVVEDADRARGLEAAEALRREGYAVAVCNGPSGRASCPLEQLDECLMVDDADVVVWRLATQPKGQEVLEGLLRRRDGRGVVVELAATASPNELVEAVGRALERPRRRSEQHRTAQ